MIATYRRLQRRRAAGEIDGFTLIELLIVIVVLGILAAVVIFALGGVTGKSQLAACQADGATVSTAIAAFHANNPGVTVTSGDLTAQGTFGAGTGSSYLVSWPHATSYSYWLNGNQLLIGTAKAAKAAAVPYNGPSSCSSTVTGYPGLS